MNDTEKTLVCWLFFGVRSIPVLPHWHMKDPGHSAKSAGGRLQLNTHTPLTQWSCSGLTMPLSRHDVGTDQENKLTCNSSGNTRPWSSQLAEPLWTDPGLKSGISVRELISSLKKKKAQVGNKLLNILPKSSHMRKKPPPPLCWSTCNEKFFYVCYILDMDHRHWEGHFRMQICTKNNRWLLLTQWAFCWSACNEKFLYVCHILVIGERCWERHTRMKSVQN